MTNMRCSFFHRNYLFLFTGFAGRIDEALQLFEKMKEVGIQPGKVCNLINNLIVTLSIVFMVLQVVIFQSFCPVFLESLEKYIRYKTMFSILFFVLLMCIVHC